MKKLLYLVLIVAFALPVFISCDKENGYQAGIIYHLTVSDDLRDLCDIVVSYRDADSTIRTHKMTASEWKEMVLHKTYTFNTWLGYELKLKPNAKLTKDKYEILVDYEIFNNYNYNLRGQHGDEGAMNTIIDSIVQKDQLESIIAALNKKGQPIISIDYVPGSCHVVEGDFEDCKRYLKYYNQYDIDSATEAFLEELEKADSLKDTTVKK